MSWTQTFPVLTDELVSEYHQRATSEERSEAKEWFRVERVLNRQDRAHIVPFALYHCPLYGILPEFPVPTEKNLRKMTDFENGKVPSFHKHQVLPMIKGARALQKECPDVVVRVYLAKDLEFLADKLAEAGCEVCMMAHSSLRHSPGALWRFLPLAEKGRLVTISDPTYSSRVILDIVRTDAMLRAGHGFWRVPYAGGGMGDYRPISRSQFGAMSGLPVQKLAEALIWHTKKKSIAQTCTPPGGCGPMPIKGARWPDMGFDEWFLLSAIYPRAARKGMLTLANAATTSIILPLDVEYATWANPRSELAYFGEAAKGCCAPASEAKKKKKERIPPLEVPYWNKWDKLPLLMNLHGLCGTAVKLGARSGEQSGEFLADWKGKKWHVVEQWKPRGKTDWVDSENFQDQKAWDFARSRFNQALKHDKRVNMIESSDEVAAKQFKKGSLDLVWLNEDRSYQGILKAIARWWPLLRDGGIMAGIGAKDQFHGSPYGTHSWHAVHSALVDWRRKTGHGFYLTTDGKDGWLMFKTNLPKPAEVLVITGATKEVTYAPFTTANHRAYCKKWGYQYHCYGEEGFDRSRQLPWSKILMMKDALLRSKWVVWIDCDAVFADWSLPISRLCLEPFELISSIWNYADTVRPSSGVFVMKSGTWAQKFLSAVWRYPRSHNKLPHEEDGIWSHLKRNPKLAKGLFAVQQQEFNSPATLDGKLNDPVLHFLQLKDTRTPILQDVCKMIEQRNQ